MEKTILLIKAGFDQVWAELLQVDDTYSIPLNVCEVLHGKHEGEKIAAMAVYGKIITQARA